MLRKKKMWSPALSNRTVLISELNGEKYKTLWQVKQLTCMSLLCIFSCCLEFSFNIFIGIILCLLLFSKVGFHFSAAKITKPRKPRNSKFASYLEFTKLPRKLIIYRENIVLLLEHTNWFSHRRRKETPALVRRQINNLDCSVSSIFFFYAAFLARYVQTRQIVAAARL